MADRIDNFWRWVGGRRFSLTVGAGIINTVLLWASKISESTFKELTVATVAVYIAANTTQKWREANASAKSD